MDFDRPKTSRGVANPSPEEFVSYIVPSPFQDSKSHTLRLDNSPGKRTITDTKDPSRVAVALGCWLFGSGMHA